jgi:hypothetical protein
MTSQSSVKPFLASAAWCLVLGAGVRPISAQEVGPKDAPDGPVPSVEATETAAAGPVQFRLSPDQPAARPNHPPISLIPPMPMPTQPEGLGAAAASSGPGKGVLFDPRTRKVTEFDSGFGVLKEGTFMGGGYAGADGGESVDESLRPANPSAAFTLISTAARAADPWRMNVKVVLRFGVSYFVCSGTMRDARTVLTAGHCVHQGGPSGNWADEIWVYPGWDGAGSLVPPETTSNPYGWAHSTALGSWTGWTASGDITYDVGLVALDRAVGVLTGWFGWYYGGSCAFWTSTTINNASYPAESCGGGLHTGQDMYFWSGLFNSCPSDRRLGLNTSPGCLNAIWGGMSGSGVYIVDSGNRYVHGITSTSNRSTYAEYQRQWQDWVDWSNNTFIPTSGRGAAFDLQPLDVNAAPAVIPAGGSTTLLNHLATNATNGTANGTWTFRVYLSTNDNIETSDTLLSTQSYNWDFAALGSVTVNMAQVTIPPNTPPGNYYLGLIYDNATDANASNNDTDGWDAVPIRVTKPDLDITALAAPVSARPGDSIDVSNTVQNIGSAASGAFRVGLYYSVDSTCTTGDTLMTFRPLASLDAGATSAAITPVTIPAGATPGTRYVCAIADDLGQVTESNEGNNTAFTAISIVQADLTVSVLSGPANASPGSGIVISNTVGNAGTTASGPFRMGLYLSTDATCTTGDVLVGSRAVASLGPGIASNANTAATIPAATALGAYFLCGIADDLGAVAESSEANNTRSSPVNVVSATPVITLKVNGQHPSPPTVPVAGPTLVTLDVSPSTYTASVDWYWAIIYNGQIVWVTSTGLSATPAPWFNAPPVALTNVTLLNLNLPAATTMTNVVFMLNAGTTVSFDFITATRP